MATVYQTYYVSAADKAAAEDMVDPFVESAGGIFGVSLTTYPGDPTATPTHFGGCASMSDSSGLYTSLQTIPTVFPAPSGNTQVVSPWRSFNAAVHWHAWLNSNGLQVATL